MARLFRSDDPATPVDIPGKPVRSFWTRDLEPTPAPATRATKPPNNPRGDEMKQTKPTREQQAKRDAAERLRARQDDAMAHLRNAHKRPSRGMTKQDARQATVGTSPQAQTTTATTADDAFASMRNAWRK